MIALTMGNDSGAASGSASDAQAGQLEKKQKQQ
jgi:hypothetical protein